VTDRQTRCCAYYPR